MFSIHKIVVLLVLLISAISPFHAVASTNATIYEGKSAGFTVKWTTSDIVATDSQGKVVFSARKQAESDFRALIKDREKGMDYSYEQHHKVLSLVGPILSLSISDFETGTQNGQPAEAHPGGETRYVALDLRSPEPLAGKMMDGGLAYDPDTRRAKMFVLNKLFAEKPLLKALAADKVIQEAAEDSLDTTSIKAFLESIDGKALTGEGQCGTLDRVLLNAFAFHHLEKGGCAVRLGVSGAGPCRYNLTQLGLLLPVAAQYKTWFDNAATKKEGIMMRDLHKLAVDRQTDFEFTTKKSKK